MVGLEEEEEKEKGMRRKGRGCRPEKSEGRGSHHGVGGLIGRLGGGGLQREGGEEKREGEGWVAGKKG